MSAPNYKEVNQIGHRTFQSGMLCFEEYLNNALESNTENKESIDNMAVVTINKKSSSTARRVDFSRPELCAGCNPVECTINGETLAFDYNWRDIIVALADKFLSEKNPSFKKLLNIPLLSRSTTPFLIKTKPERQSRQISNGYYICVDYSIPMLVLIIGELCNFCGLNLDDVEIKYMPKNNFAFPIETENISKVITTKNDDDLLASVIYVLAKNYSNGFRFDSTTLRLLSDESGVVIDDTIQTNLNKLMFKRNDDIYFLIDNVAEKEILDDIINKASEWLNNFGCFEIAELYELFSDIINSSCIYDVTTFEEFYESITNQTVRCVGVYNTRIARQRDSNIQNLFSTLAANFVKYTHKECSGVISEDDLKNEFPAFSLFLISVIIKEYTEDLIKTEINGIVCYQTLDSLGLTEDFSDTLLNVIADLDNLSLIITEDSLHTALSLKLGVNFKIEYNIPDDKTYRRLIDTYYKNGDAPKRKWLRGIFAEVRE
jgi:hypothetical protein